MRFTILFITLLALFQASWAFATEVHLHPDSTQFQRGLFNRFLSVFDKVSDQLNSIPQPTSLKLKIIPPSPTANYIDGTITIAAERTSENGHRQHPKFTDLVLAHEYGHAIFESALRDRVPIIDEKLRIYRKTNAMHKRFQSMEKELEELMVKRDKLDKESPEYAELSETIKKLKYETYDLDEAVFESGEGFYRLKKQLEPYEEMWADLVAIMYSGDPKGVFHALYFTGDHDPLRKKGYFFRDFSKSFGAARYEEWKQLIETHADEYFEVLPHLVLVPARYYFYQKFIGDLRNQIDWPFVMNRLITAFTEVINNEKIKLHDVEDIERINQVLITSLSQLQ